MMGGLNSQRKYLTAAREMAQQLRVPAALTEDPSSVLNAHVKWLRITSNSSSKGSNALFWPLLTPALTHAHLPAPTQTHLKIK